MEASVWTDPRVKDLLENEYILITLMVDDKTKLPEIIEVDENGRTTRLKTIGDKWSYPTASQIWRKRTALLYCTGSQRETAESVIRIRPKCGEIY